jgi:hypothetical protein
MWWLWRNEWQWLGGSGTVGKRRLMRFEWWLFEGVAVAVAVAGCGSNTGVLVGCV